MPPPVPANHGSPLCFGGSARLVWDVIWPRADNLLLSPTEGQHSHIVHHSSVLHIWSHYSRTESTCQREVRPPGAGRSQQSGASPSTILLTCPRITPRLREGPCSALLQEVTCTVEYELKLTAITSAKIQQFVWKFDSKWWHTCWSIHGAFKDKLKNWILELATRSLIWCLRFATGV